MSKSSQQYYEHSRQFEEVELLEREYLIKLQYERYFKQHIRISK